MSPAAPVNPVHPSADELTNLFFSVIPEYRRAGTWMMSDATWAGVRKLKDTTNQYLIDRLGAMEANCRS